MDGLQQKITKHATPMASNLEPIRPPRLLPMPDVDNLEKVKGLFCESSDAWVQEDYEVFVQKLAEAFSLDIHDFTMVMNIDKHMQRACACVAMMEQEGAETIYFHTLKVAMSLVDCSGYTLHNGVPYNDHSRNFVIRKWTNAIPSTLRLLVCQSEAQRKLTLLPHLEYWKVLQMFGILANCLGNIVLATHCFQRVKIVAESSNVDFSAMTEIERISVD
jgi:hypothetical protein